MSDAELYLYAYRVYDPIAGRWAQRDPIDYQDSVNLYQFCGNNPVNNNDPDGEWVQGLIGATIGAAVGVGAVAVQDILSGERSGWEKYSGAAVGGAITGGLIAEFVPPSIAGAAGAAAGNFAEQLANKISGKQDHINIGSIAKDAVIGGVLGHLAKGAKISGINKGRGSMLSVAKSMRTKLNNGTISRVSVKTAAKSALGLCQEHGIAEGALTWETINSDK